MNIKICEICGKAFTAKRKDAKFCSSACRTRNYRNPPIKGPVFGESLRVSVCSMTTEDLDGLALRAHGVASDFSFASLCVSGELADKFARVSTQIEQTLRNEGL